MADATLPAQLALHVQRLLDNCIRSVADLTPEQLNHQPNERSHSIGWDIWHVVRTVDNVVLFVFDREHPVWLRDGFDARFGLPKVAQGTGMTDEEARALRFPPAADFVQYIEAVRDVVVPRLAVMTDEYLSTPTTVRPWGEQPRAEHVMQVVVAHGNGHLGRCSLARALLGKDDLGI
ncbi:MAG: DinB family protein [Dehalococcoidia bacterium]|nr:DinB family protein [Dehalococcoidia bacterium]